MKRLFFLSFHNKMLFVFFLLINIPFIIGGYIVTAQMRTMVIQEKEDKLLSLAGVLDARLGEGGFAAILEKSGKKNSSREEQIAVLNAALSDRTDEIGEAIPGLGIGYYSLALDAIITYGPSSSFASMVGVSIPPEHPGRIAMRLNQNLVRTGTMVRGDIMNAMHPIERGGEVIGYIWANELSTDVNARIRDMSRNIALIMLFCFILTFTLMVLLSRRTFRDVDRILGGLRAMREDLGARIKGAKGEIGEIANSINAMAEDIGNANAEIKRAMAVLQSVLDNVDATVYVCDPATKQLVYANDYLCKMLQAGNVAGKLCYEVLQGRSDPCPFCPQKQLFDEQGNPKINVPVRWETHNPVIKRDFLVTDRLITWHDGRLLHMEVGTDVTERKALAVAEAANLAQRDFLARMSHELRTPMNGVLGMTRLAMQASPPPAQLEYLEKIQSSAALLLGIINDILDFSRIEAGKLTIDRHHFNLRKMIENIVELVSPNIHGKKLNFTINVDPEVPVFALGDDLRISQVLLNLLGNASKFTLEGYVTLSVSAKPVSDSRFRLYCSVRDSGIGMTAEQIGSLFTPFSQADASTSRKFGGTGLGLSISKALVEYMNGEVRVESEPGKGSLFSFYVELEYSSESAEEAETSEALWLNARYDGYNFLVVEDNLINQEIAKALLEDLGATVDVADNGEEGVKAFLNKDYSLIFMDVRMPIMDGLEAARNIKASSKHDASTVPIVAMTANAMNEDREASKEAGMVGHVAKPIDLDELKSTLYNILLGAVSK